MTQLGSTGGQHEGRPRYPCPVSNLNGYGRKTCPATVAHRTRAAAASACFAATALAGFASRLTAESNIHAAIKVGVVLARRVGDLAEWLADAASFDAAGAHALWIDVLPHPQLDPLALTAALAAMTSRSLLVVELRPHRTTPRPWQQSPGSAVAG
jgi:hypothetical protein